MKINDLDQDEEACLENSNQNCWVEIKKTAIQHNINEIRKYSKKTEIMPIVKSEAYGHGITEVAKICQGDGIDSFGVATVEEGVRLRKIGVKGTILVLYNTPANKLDAVLSSNLSISLFDKNLASDLDKKSSNKAMRAKVHIPVDTGMGWYGLNPEEAKDFIIFLSNLKNIEIEGIYSHFAKTNSKEFSKQQINKFNKLIKFTEKKGILPKYIHMAKSSGVISYGNSLFDMVRPGLILYGVYPRDIGKNEIELRPAMSVKTRIFQVRKLPKGSPISYDGTYITKRNSKIAVLPIGYSNGLNRYLSNRGKVIIKGRKFPIIGNICMNICIVDVTGSDNIEAGDIVTILGKDGCSVISANDIASMVNTTRYEVLTSFGSRNPRIYIN